MERGLFGVGQADEAQPGSACELWEDIACMLLAQALILKAVTAEWD